MTRPSGTFVEAPGRAYSTARLGVADFSAYRLILDVRSRADFLADHIPGARHVDLEPLAAPLGTALGSTPMSVRDVEPALGLQYAIADQLRSSPPGARILVCSDPGDSGDELAALLRLEGREVDLVPGGWRGYRAWVEEGLRVVPPMVPFQVLRGGLGIELASALEALQAEGHQVIDWWSIANWQPGSTPLAPQPSQGWFESQVLDRMRAVTGLWPVWVPELPDALGRLRAPAALRHAVADAPVAELRAPVEVRIQLWRSQEQALGAGSEAAIRALASTTLPPPADVLTGYGRTGDGGTDALLQQVLLDHLDLQVRQFAGQAERPALPALEVDTFDRDALREAIRRWIPQD